MTQPERPFVEALKDASVFLPELPESQAYDVHEAITSYEHQLVVPNAFESIRLASYADGTATQADQLKVINPLATQNGLLLTAEHATDPVRKATGKREGADHGTGGLTWLLAEQNDSTAVIPVGKQTGNAAVDEHHPLKQQMDLFVPKRAAYLSLHGMISGKIKTLEDPTEIHGVIGLGKAEHEPSRSAAEKLVKLARDELNLKLVIGNDTRFNTYDPKTNDFIRDENGEVKPAARLAALGAGSTTNFLQTLREDYDLDTPGFQIEMTRALRLLPHDFENGKPWHKDHKAEVMGVYAGYLLGHYAMQVLKAHS